ncbi:MAG: hypothetical protein K2K64_00280 [Muribaculaceae bacterium]|nr:hypothetical protein [Muribaculaceae bacterium]
MAYTFFEARWRCLSLKSVGAAEGVFLCNEKEIIIEVQGIYHTGIYRWRLWESI